jgi:pyrroline-5-carboxylate reductase
MAGSIIKGIVESGLVSAGQVVAHDPNTAKLAALAKATGITAEAGNEEVVSACDVVVLAVKPQVLPQLMEQLAARLVASNPLVVSIAAGITLAHLDGWLGPNVAVVRVMPNLNVAVGAGMAAVAGNSVASDLQVEQVRELFAAVGQAMVLEERLFPAFTAVAGSSPAWVFMFIDALARGGLAAGMSKQQATEAACQAVLGSAKLLAEDPERHAWQLIDQVSSPGGTTVAGLNTLEERGFGAAVVAAVAATIKREAELSQSAT